MDYKSMSDFEINKMVGSIVGYATGIEPCFEMVIRNANGKKFNPCNNPADAWSIIVDNKISIDYLGQQLWGAKAFVSIGEPKPRYAESNPLRAAMIVFLMIKSGDIK